MIEIRVIRKVAGCNLADHLIQGKIITYNNRHDIHRFSREIHFMGTRDFDLEDPLDIVHDRCLDVIKALGWKIRYDLTRADQITCYVPMPELLPQAPVYFIALYPLDQTTHVVLGAANDELSQLYAPKDLLKLQTAITSEDAPPTVESVVQAKCFISYRRYDSADVVGRIYDRLVTVYGAENVFRDVDNIPLGMDFRKILDEAVGSCAVLLVIIGRDWVTVTNESNQRRLDDPADFVRIELESALQRNIPIVPLLVRDASMPREEELPASLRQLVYRNGTRIRSDPDFHHDMDRLIQALNRFIGIESQ
jgi:hypothetical protein